ncbi:GNAT family N-acetyltransferase [Sinorhizobium sp. RAC02]|uniref:GNAT family N-acetyltransferase n=1 Tax=Sinorhizobium sp. RAC02 TaxID=1842534 RepID=UPI000856F2BD|nr:GNAT family N-acetyltransferase [Sinorhizobium sp. RAC02]AOF88928.1 acetyltransferase domain protein [Sinorhizobium sp. RAC02]
MAMEGTGTADDAAVQHHVLRDRSAMHAVAADWRALDARAADPLTYFQSFDWCQRWLDVVADARCRPEIHTLRQGGNLVAVWPLMLSGTAVKRLEPLGWPHSQYANLLIDPTFDGREAARRLLGGLANTKHDVAVMESVPAGSALTALFQDTSPLSGRGNSAAMLDLSVFASPDAYAAALSKTQRRNRNRRRNALSRHGPLSFCVLFPGEDGFADAIATCLDFKRTWLRETGRRSTGFAFAGFDDFLASLPGRRDDLSGACLSVLKAGDRLVAGELGFLHHGHYHAYLGAFDWDLRDASPGKAQMDMTVCWLIDQGVKTYDLLGHPADYKESWSNRTLDLSAYALPVTLAGRAYAGLWTAWLRPGLKQIYERLPHQLRRLARLGQSFALFLMIA